MKVLKGDKGSIDFERPLELSKMKQERLFTFLQSVFYCVEFKHTKSFRDQRLGSKMFIKEWEDEELKLLLKLDEDNDAISKKLGRSWMSVEMRRIPLINDMLIFAKEKGKDIYSINLIELVDDFVKERKEKFMKQRQAKKEERLKKKKEKKEYFSLKEELPRLKSLFEQGIIKDKENLEKQEKRLEELKQIIKEDE